MFFAFTNLGSARCHPPERICPVPVLSLRSRCPPAECSGATHRNVRNTDTGATHRDGSARCLSFLCDPGAPEQNAPVPPTVMPGTPIRVPPTGVAPESGGLLRKVPVPCTVPCSPHVDAGCFRNATKPLVWGTGLPGATHWNARNRFRNTNACRCGPSGRRVSTGLVPADRLQRFR